MTRWAAAGVAVLAVAMRIPGAVRDAFWQDEVSSAKVLVAHSPVSAIRQVARGGSYVSPSLASALITGLGGGGRRRHDVLSDREYQVLCLFGSGISFKHIAAELGVSPKTVSTYRSRILEKLKLKSNAAIIRYAIEHRLVPASITAPPQRRKSTTGHSAGR